jgi:hypothetical protein
LAERGVGPPAVSRPPDEPLLALDLRRRTSGNPGRSSANPPPPPPLPHLAPGAEPTAPMTVPPSVHGRVAGAAPTAPAQPAGDARAGNARDARGQQAVPRESQPSQPSIRARAPDRPIAAENRHGSHVAAADEQAAASTARYPLPVTLPQSAAPADRSHAVLGFVTGLVIAAAIGLGLYVYLVGL